MKYFANYEILGRFSLLAGDAIHNLKSALDYAWFDLTFADNPIGERSIKFPISPTREHLEQFIERRKEQQSVNRLSGILLNTIKPYKAGNVIGDLIYALHQLNIHDKHRLMIPQVQVSHIRDIDADNRRIFDGTRVVYASNLMNTYGVEDKHQGDLCASVIFGDGPYPVKGKPVLQTIRGFETVVRVTLLFLAQ